MAHDIFWAKMGVTCIIVEALFQSVTCIRRLWELFEGRYTSLALMSSRQLVEHVDVHCLYAELQEWYELHGITTNAVPPVQ